jgi:NAD(P)-dependent dehydrogenase (short-subunit alcohol dehydrogenase family)
MSPSPSNGRLSGRRALITGASRGIGRAIALRYAAEGAQLMLAATTPAALEAVAAEARAAGATAHVHALDVRDRAAVQALVDDTVARLGGIDVLVNNAGIYHVARLLDTEPEDFDRVMQVNLYGAFHVLQLVLRQMQAQRGGQVVNIASTAGKWGSMNQSAYNASKHALVGLTRCAALEMAAAGVTVNAICPGFVETDMLEALATHAELQGLSLEQLEQAARARVPLRRFMQPGDVADLAVYLGSTESRGMTGQSLALDGGMVLV